jgi:Spy/CpxP family protein refolding chaperone
MNRISVTALKTLMAVLLLSVSAGAVCAADNLNHEPDAASPLQQVAGQSMARLEHLGQALNLQGQQQAAWHAFLQAERSEFRPLDHPAENANIVEISEFRADQADQRAQRLADESDAVHQLWDKLDDPQRMTFDRAMQREMMLRWHDLRDARQSGDQRDGDRHW